MTRLLTLLLVAVLVCFIGNHSPASAAVVTKPVSKPAVTVTTNAAVKPASSPTTAKKDSKDDDDDKKDGDDDDEADDDDDDDKSKKEDDDDKKGSSKKKDSKTKSDGDDDDDDTDDTEEKKRDDDKKDDDEDYDRYGCCISCGEFYCPGTEECVSDWDKCKLGSYNSQTCQYFYNNTIHGFSFDLSQYKLGKENYYVITDEVSHPDQEFRYYFNFCQNVKSSVLPNVCQSTTGAANEVCENDALAYQYFYGDWGYSACYRLSDCSKSKQKIEMGLLDPVEPAGGIYIKYFGGNSCPNSYADKDQCDDVVSSYGRNITYCARTFTVNINCNDEIKHIPIKEKVAEAAGCNYEVTINHRMGCPVECPRNPHNHRVCSGRGSCYYSGYDNGFDSDDNDNVGLQCTCQSGYGGDACEITTSMIYQISEGSGAPVWLVYFVFALFLLSVFVLLASSFDKVLFLLRGDFQSALPFLYGKRIAMDGRGFYTTVDDVDIGDNEMEVLEEYTMNPAHTATISTSSSRPTYGGTKFVDVSLNGKVSDEGNAEEFNL